MKKNHLLSVTLTALLASAGIAWGQGAITSKGNAVFSIAGQSFIVNDSLLLMDKNFAALDSTVKRTVDNNASTAVAASKAIKMTEKLVNNGTDATFSWDVAIAPVPEGKNVELTLKIPTAMLDQLPVRGNNNIMQIPQNGNLSLMTPFGEIILSSKGSSENVSWELDDLRNIDWAKCFRLRTSPNYDPQKGTNFKAVLNIQARPFASDAFVCIPLAKAANRPLRDDVNGDQKGGWTDQGSNDLRALKLGINFAQGIPFNFADEAIVLHGLERPYFPVESPVITVPKGLKAERLCFAHTVAWSAKFRETAFSYIVNYADGNSVTVPVLYRVHTCDWWGASEPLEARFAWKGINFETDVAVHHMQWKNPRPDVAITGIKVASFKNNPVVPAVIGITAVKADALTTQQLAMLDEAFATREVAPKVDMSDWFECPLSWNGTIVSGSALDVSFMNHRPAGKYGWLKISDGAFVFEQRPDEPLKFWGTNAALHGPFPEKSDAVGIADTLAKQGVNMLRLHLLGVYDDCLIGPDGNLSPDALDRCEFFIAELKKRGIYIYMDLNDGMLYQKLVGHPLPDEGKGAKYASLFDPELVNATKKYARQFYTHFNPYTKLRMVDDPAICVYEITNENSITMNWFDLNKSLAKPWRDELENLWIDWQKKNGIQPQQPLPANFTNAGVNGRRFAAELQKAHLDDMRAYLKSLGVKAPICGTNITFTIGDLWASENMEFTNDHAYADHPNVGARPMTYNNGVTLTSNATRLGIMPSFTRAKVAGKPVCASEWNFCFPNDSRCEGLPFMTAYSAFQNWDSLIFYCATGSFDGGSWSRFHKAPGILVHSQHTDPATWGLTQACALAFRRADIRKSNKVVTLKYTMKDVWDNLNVAGRWPFLTAFARVETQLVKDRPDNLWPMEFNQDMSPMEQYFDAAKRLGITGISETKVTGDTNEITRYTDCGLLTVDTAKTKMATGKLASLSDEKSLKDFTVSSPCRFGTVTLTSLDDLPVTQSKRMLLCVVANARNKDGKFDGSLIYDMGKGPVLAEPVEATFTITSAIPLKAYKLNTLTGARNGELPVNFNNGKATFSIDKQTRTMYIELTR